MKIIDLSETSFLNKTEHWNTEINQLYHPLSDSEAEEFNIVYSKDILNKTKFVSILLKEWFYLVEKCGYLVIDYHPNKICGPIQLEKLMWKLFKGKYEIIFHNFLINNQQNEKEKDLLIKFIKNCDKNAKEQNENIFQNKLNRRLIRFVSNKKESLKINNDSINKWSFGIITNGKRNNWVEEIIQSIVKQKIPWFEIIICGTYFSRKEKYIKYFPFSERDKLGWITKKKNLIAKKAKYENLCFVHDRIIFDKDWYKGIKKWGNNFEFLCGPITYNGKRAGDWLTWPGLYKVRMLDYRDYDRNTYIGGMYFIIKKNIYLNNLLDETRYWMQEEDIDFSERLKNNGIIPRFNPLVQTKALAYSQGIIPLKPFNKEKDEFIYFPVDSYKKRINQIVARILKFYHLDRIVYSILKNK